MFRLPSQTVRGSPAVGLLLMRIAVASTVAFRAPAPSRAELLAALLLLGGLWTPTVAVVIAAVECWRAATQSGGWVSLLLTAIALALALIGPGIWSVDARILGWRRIDIPAGSKRAGGIRSE